MLTTSLLYASGGARSLVEMPGDLVSEVFQRLGLAGVLLVLTPGFSYGVETLTGAVRVHVAKHGQYCGVKC